MLFQPHETDRLVHQLFSSYFVFHIKPAEIIYVFIHCQFVKYRHILKYDPHVLFYQIIVRSHLLSKDPDHPFIIFQKSQHTVDRCGLP